jgi:hypothetical protein
MMTATGGPWPDLDCYFKRLDGIAAALDHDCPFCGAVAGAKCGDRWGQPSRFVHHSRAQRAGYLDDPYPLDEGPGIERGQMRPRDDLWRFTVGPPPEPKGVE